MNFTFVGLLAIIAYSAATALIGYEIYRNRSHHFSKLSAWLGVALHAVAIGLNLEQSDGFNFSFFHSTSLVSLVVAGLLLFAALDKPVEKLGCVIFPFTALMLGLSLSLSEPLHPVTQHSWQMTTHILTSITAFSLLNIAALQAILLALQDRQLRSHHPKPLIRSLPPLQAMESLLFQMIALGVAFLSVSLVSGLIFIEDMFAQHLVHKTVLSIIAWLIFSALLLGRVRHGWRGQTAIRWTLAGFVLLLLAYFGSKMVLEIILHKT